MDSTLVWQRNRITETTLLLLTLVACLIAAPAAGSELAHLQLESSGLEDLGPGWAYEGWLIEGGMPISTGTFTVAADGSPSRMYFTAEVDDRNQIDAFVLTVEP
ncbi:MAG: anti-sigma factor, partial [Acidobacteriota bacterium]